MTLLPRLAQSTVGQRCNHQQHTHGASVKRRWRTKPGPPSGASSSFKERANFKPSKNVIMPQQLNLGKHRAKITGQQLTPISLGITYDPKIMDWVKIEARQYGHETYQPTSWAVCRGGTTAMSKSDGVFYCEPIPSNRDQKYFNEFRFNSVDEALQTYIKFHDL